MRFLVLLCTYCAVLVQPTSQNQSRALLSYLEHRQQQQQQQQAYKAIKRVPWITSDLLPLVDYRKGDIIISVPSKSGTTWTMNIVNQLRSGGDGNFTDIYWEVPWLEFLEYPGQNYSQLLSRWEHFPRSVRRAFKVHPAPPELPFLSYVKYVVVVRNGLDAIASMVPFLNSIAPSMYELWQTERRVMTEEKALQMMTADTSYSGINFVRDWWPYRRYSNVFMIHFCEMKSNLPAVLRRLAAFLDIEVKDTQWPMIERHCSFEWMRNHSSKFEITEVLKDVPTYNCHCIRVLSPGGMVRKGTLGDGQNLTAETVASFNRIARERLTPEQYHWFMKGGVLPPLAAVEWLKQDL